MEQIQFHVSRQKTVDVQVSIFEQLVTCATVIYFIASVIPVFHFYKVQYFTSASKLKRGYRINKRNLRIPATISITFFFLFALEKIFLRIFFYLNQNDYHFNLITFDMCYYNQIYISICWHFGKALLFCFYMFRASDTFSKVGNALKFKSIKVRRKWQTDLYSFFSCCLLLMLQYNVFMYAIVLVYIVSNRIMD